jgi:hypothetical protein
MEQCPFRDQGISDRTAFKSEARISKSETNSNIQIRNAKGFLFGSFEHLDFGFVSDWSETDASPDIRISNFLTSHACLVQLCRVRFLNLMSGLVLRMTDRIS